MRIQFQDLKQLATRHLRGDVVKILEQNQLVLWDKNGVFVVKTPEINLKAYAFKTVGEEISERAKHYTARLSMKILGRRDEKIALKVLTAYLLYRRTYTQILAKRAKSVYLQGNHTHNAQS